MPSAAKNSRKQSPRSLPERVAVLLWRPWMIGAMFLLGMAPVIWSAIDVSLPDLPVLKRQQILTEHIQLVEAPAYLPSTVVSDVIGEEGHWALNRMNLAEYVAKQFESHTWIRQVNEVTIQPGPEVRVSCDYRKPVGLALTSQGAFPIDEQAVLLPAKDLKPAVLSQLLPLVGVEQSPQVAEGELWNDLRIVGAARLASEFAQTEGRLPLWQVYGLKCIQIPPATAEHPWSVDTAQYHLITQSGSRIVWGGIPGIEHPTEPDARIKMARLDRYYDDYGTFESPQGWQEIDIRPWKHVIRRSLSNTALAPSLRR